MGKLRVTLCDGAIFEKSGDQGNKWMMQELRLQGSGSKEVSTAGPCCSKTDFGLCFYFIIIN